MMAVGQKYPRAIDASCGRNEVCDGDRYGRLIVELFTENNKSINTAMICSGAAWW
jgi:endonuclease YncB( thermonuclease family)